MWIISTSTVLPARKETFVSDTKTQTWGHKAIARCIGLGRKIPSGHFFHSCPLQVSLHRPASIWRRPASERASKADPVQQVLRSYPKTLLNGKLSWDILKRLLIPCLIPQHLAALKTGNGYSTAPRRRRLFTIFSHVLCQDLFSSKRHQTVWVHTYIPPQTKHCPTKPLSFATPLKSRTKRSTRCHSQMPAEFGERECWRNLQL